MTALSVTSVVMPEDSLMVFTMSFTTAYSLRTSISYTAWTACPLMTLSPISKLPVSQLLESSSPPFRNTVVLVRTPSTTFTRLLPTLMELVLSTALQSEGSVSTGSRKFRYLTTPARDWKPQNWLNRDTVTEHFVTLIILSLFSCTISPCSLRSISCPLVKSGQAAGSNSENAATVAFGDAQSYARNARVSCIRTPAARSSKSIRM